MARAWERGRLAAAAAAAVVVVVKLIDDDDDDAEVVGTGTGTEVRELE